MANKTKYKRILIKLSGNAFKSAHRGIDFEVTSKLAGEIADVKKLGVDIAMVVGSGNLFRGAEAAKEGMDEPAGHYVGMLATMMNALVLQDALEKAGVPTRVMSALEAQKVAEPYIRRRAIRHMEKGRIVICAGGTGNPFFTTDTAGVLRSIELHCEIMLKASNVDGVYDKDPNLEKDAKKFVEVSYNEVLEKELKVLDATAISLAREKKLPIEVFNFFEKGNLKKVVLGERIGTLIS